MAVAWPAWHPPPLPLPGPRPPDRYAHVIKSEAAVAPSPPQPISFPNRGLPAALPRPSRKAVTFPIPPRKPAVVTRARAHRVKLPSCFLIQFLPHLHNPSPFDKVDAFFRSYHARAGNETLEFPLLCVCHVQRSALLSIDIL